MRKYLFVLIVIFCAVGYGQDNVKHEAVIWYQFSEKVSLSDKWDASFTVQYRDFVQRDQDYHLFLNAGAVYKLKNGFSLGAGLINLNVNRVVGEDYLLVPEIRPYQQVMFGAKFENVQFNWRFMIEERYFRKTGSGDLANGYDFNFRLRNLAKIGVPLSDKFDVSASTEIHFNAGGRANLNHFDQHRTNVLLGYKMDKLKLSTGYMHWAVLTPDDVFNNWHTWMITASHTL